MRMAGASALAFDECDGERHNCKNWSQIPMAPQTFQPGRNVFAVNDSPCGPYSAFFDDDGEAGYFYAVDLTSDNLILDVVPVYEAAGISEPKRQSYLSIVWSADGQKCALLINGSPRAAFDFAARRGFTRTPAPMTFDRLRGSWPNSDHRWSDAAVAWLGFRRSA
jgi:hypothetical protein